MDAEVNEAIANAEPDTTRKGVPVVSQKKQNEIRRKIEAKYINRLDGNNISSITGNRNLQPNNSNDVEVVINNKNAQGQGEDSLKTGSASEVPLYASSNSENFYSTYSQLQYGVVI